MPFFDSHAHLGSRQFDPDREQVIARAVEADVARILTCGSDLASSRAELALAQSHAGVYAAAGIHAHKASSAVRGDPSAEGSWEIDEAVMADLAALTAAPEVVALGEIGLDYHYDFSPRSVQRAVLQRQLALSIELKRPVILHSRNADDDLRAVVEAAPGPLHGVWHCFLSDEQMLVWALARGLYLGVAGPVTFRNAANLPALARRMPLDRLLIETDSPYLAPHPRRGKRNEPAFVVHVAEAVARVHGVSLDEIARRTSENACRLLGVS